MTKTTLFVFLVCFWSLLGVFSNILDVQLSTSHITDYTESDIIQDTEDPYFKRLMSNIYSTLSDIPIIEYFVPLFKLMTFQYYDGVPGFLSIILSALGLLTAYIMFATIKGS